MHAFNLSGLRKLLETGEVVGPGDYVYEPEGNVDSWMAVGDEPVVVHITAYGGRSTSERTTRSCAGTPRPRSATSTFVTARRTRSYLSTSEGAEVGGRLRQAIRQARSRNRLSLGILLILGIRTRWTASLSAVLLALFAFSMAISFGVKSPLDASVFFASAAALLLALDAYPRVRDDCGEAIASSAGAPGPQDSPRSAS